MIVRARFVVTMDGAPLEDGAVEVQGNRIAQVGRWCELRRTNGGDVVDLGECALLPGLINAHCHLDYTCLRDAIPSQRQFTEWIRAINARKATLAPGDYVRSIESGFAEAASFGTTAIANFEAFPELVGRISNPPMRTWWFAEMLDLRAPIHVSRQLEVLRSRLAPLAHAGLAPHAPFTASAHLYQQAAEHDLPHSTHLAESHEEMQMFRDGCGPLFEFMQSLGRPMEDCGRQTPLALMLERGTLDARWIVVHLNELTEGDFQLLKSAPRFHLAHCPRSHAYFGHAPFAFSALRKLGFNIALGTDSLASNGDLSLFAEMRALRRNEPWLAAQEVLETVTVNAAVALGHDDTLGRIRAGFLGDLIAVPCAQSRRELLEAVLDFRGRTMWSMVNGILR
ncbi:MAG: amidohydrolase family protein [Chthoniobacterales bacterium]